MALLQGDFSSAATFYRQGLVLAREIGSKELIAYSLEGVAGAAAGQGNTNAVLYAARLWGAAQELRAALNAPLPPVDASNYDRLVATARTRCNPGAFTRAWDEGCAMSLEAAIEAAVAVAVSVAKPPLTAAPHCHS